MRVEPTLTLHPKFIRLKKRVGDIAAEVLIRLWGHCQESQRGEHWPETDAEYVEDVCAWDGQPGTLYRALLDNGWVEAEAEGVRIHNWDEMNSRITTNWRVGKMSRGKPKANPMLTLGVSQGLANGLHTETLGEPKANPINLTKPNLTKPEGGSKGEGSPSPRPSPPGEGGAVGPVVERCEREERPAGLRFDLAQEVVEFLNGATGGSFLGTPVVLHEVAARLLECSQDLPGVKQMITRQAAMWGRDEKMRAYLRPATLFEEKKFHDYYGQRSLPVPDLNKKADPAARRRELEGLIDKSPANRQSTFHKPGASEQEKEKLRGWRRELAQL